MSGGMSRATESPYIHPAGRTAESFNLTLYQLSYLTLLSDSSFASPLPSILVGRGLRSRASISSSVSLGSVVARLSSSLRSGDRRSLSGACDLPAACVGTSLCSAACCGDFSTLSRFRRLNDLLQPDSPFGPSTCDQLSPSSAFARSTTVTWSPLFNSPTERAA